MKLLFIFACALVAPFDALFATEPFPGDKADFHGCALYSVTIGPDKAQILVPEKPAAGRPWVLAAYLYDLESAPVAYMTRTELELVKRGFHVVALPLGNTFGAPDAIAKYNGLYREMTGKYGLSSQVALMGLSREGLAITRWAAANPGKVSCLYLDKAVCDFKSWPGGKMGISKGSPSDWKSLIELYHFKSEAEAMAYDHNPIELAPKLAAFKVAILYLAGEKDDAVPYSENGGRLEQEYKRLGGKFELILHKGEGHHPHGSPDPAPVVDFIQRYNVSQNVSKPTTSSRWQPAPGHIMTRWAADVNPRHPLPEYPRPQMVRKDWMSLNGLWDYASQPMELPKPEKFTGKILVPYPVESALSGVRKPLWRDERLWYRRTFKSPKLADGKRLLLNFGAVDWEAKVFVNGKPVGEHRGGYDAFTFDITDAITPGADNELVVAVFDATGGGQANGKQNYNKFNKPAGITYTASSGIWQTVWLETVAPAHIENLKLIPDVDAGCLRVTVGASGAAPEATAEIIVMDGRKTVSRICGKPGEELPLPIQNPHLWTPADPFLYHLKVTIGADEVTSYFGMRKIALGKDDQGITRLWLNGKPVFQAGPLDQGFWPDGLYTAPTDEALRWDIEQMKRLGFNMVRKHVKIEPARWYYWCDKLGLLVWQDMPSGGGGGKADEPGGDAGPGQHAAQFETELRALVEQHQNHPSIILWVVFNESWGQYSTARLSAWVKELDPSRLVNSASGWTDRKTGDIVDAHSYPGPACPKPEPTRAAVLGEFGGLGLSTPGHTWVESAWGYRGVTSERALTHKYLELWRKVSELKKEGLCAAVYTQLTDVETEGNGLFTYDRKVLKVDAKQVADAHRGVFAPPTTFEVIEPTVQHEPAAWRYTTEQPGEDWFKPTFDAALWRVGTAGFGTANFTNAPVRTVWDTDEIWLRRVMVLPKGKLNFPALKVFHGQAAEVFINGVLAAKLNGRSSDYEEFYLKPELAKTLRTGANQIAVHCQRGQSAPFIDAELVQESTK